jgi:hypothetical protein
MSTGTRILVLLTDGHDVGSKATLDRAITTAQRASVVVYAIAAGGRADSKTLERMAGQTGGRLFDASHISQLGAIYAALGRELDRTWQISYLTRARPGDSLTFRLQAGTATAVSQLRVPGRSATSRGPLPASLTNTGATAAVLVILAAILLGAAGTAVTRQRRGTEITRLLRPHVKQRDETQAGQAQGGRLEALTAWTESALADLPGAARMTRSVERSGLKVRLGQVPYLALIGAFFLGIVGTIVGAGPIAAVFLMLIGFGLPFVLFSVAAAKRKKAFDRQLPDVLATIALHTSRRSRPPDRAACSRRRWQSSRLGGIHPCPRRGTIGSPLARSDRGDVRANRVGGPRLRRDGDQRSVAGRRLSGDALRHTLRDGSRASEACAEGPRADLDGENLGDDPDLSPVRPCHPDDADQPGIHGAVLQDVDGTVPDGLLHRVDGQADCSFEKS